MTRHLLRPNDTADTEVEEREPVTMVAVGLGALFGSQYDALDRVDLPRVPYSDGELTAGGVLAGVFVLVITLIGALIGGALGHRYHDRVDRMAGHSVVE